ncbi:MAG: STAS domain-containing protein [SAR324 cluster bacterium]|nr:STAS domain-containing protein [SAR324 cluster bacterium]
MKIEHRFEKNICIFQIEGNMVHEKMREFKSYLSPFLENQSLHGIAIDFANVGVIDSAAIGVLVGIYKRLEEHEARLALFNLKSYNREAIELNQLQNIILMYPTEAEALTALNN